MGNKNCMMTVSSTVAPRKLHFKFVIFFYLFWTCMGSSAIDCLSEGDGHDFSEIITSGINSLILYSIIHLYFSDHSFHFLLL